MLFKRVETLGTAQQEAIYGVTTETTTIHL